MKKNLLSVFVMAFLCASPFLFSSCGGGEVIDLSTTFDNNAGKMFASTQASGTIEVTYGNVLNVAKGETVEFSFKPEEKYEQYTFEVTYIIDGKTAYKDKKYSYSVSDLEAGEHTFEYSASVNIHDGKTVELSASGKFKILVQ